MYGWRQRTRARHMSSDSHTRISPSSDLIDAGCVRRAVTRYRNGVIEPDQDWLATEVPIALSYNGEAHVVMLATPMDLRDFALGFSLCEAIIGSRAELEAIDIQEQLEGIQIDMRVAPARATAIAQRQRNLSGRSSCGLCGTQHLQDVVRHPLRVADGPLVTALALHIALGKLDAAQPLNLHTGATHAAAWASLEGSLRVVREDVGRHNALDKLVGAMSEQDINVREGFLILTSRASYEMVQKAATMGIGLIAAISAPTALAIHLAESCGLTLIGFARNDSHVIYTHPQRIAAMEP
jgi:FdhD protein